MAWTLDKVVGLLVGGALGIRVLDGRKNVLARAAYGLVGYDLISSALAAQDGRALLGDAEGERSGPNRVPLNFEKRQVKSIEQRVAWVHEQMVKGTHDPKIYALARAVITQRCGDDWCVPPKDNAAEAKALFEEVRKRVRYTWDPTDYDAFQTPEKTLALRAGDCDDMVSLLGAMLRTIGLKVRSRIVQTTGNTTWNHIYLLVQIPGKGWMPLDPTVKQPAGWEVPSEYIIRKKDFDVVEKGGAAVT